MSKATDTAVDEDEWTVEGFIAECDRITDNPPPAPDAAVEAPRATLP